MQRIKSTRMKTHHSPRQAHYLRENNKESLSKVDLENEHGNELYRKSYRQRKQTASNEIWRGHEETQRRYQTLTRKSGSILTDAEEQRRLRIVQKMKNDMMTGTSSKATVHSPIPSDRRSNNRFLKKNSQSYPTSSHDDASKNRRYQANHKEGYREDCRGHPQGGRVCGQMGNYRKAGPSTLDLAMAGGINGALSYNEFKEMRRRLSSTKSSIETREPLFESASAFVANQTSSAAPPVLSFEEFREFRRGIHQARRKNNTSHRLPCKTLKTEERRGLAIRTDSGAVTGSFEKTSLPRYASDASPSRNQIRAEKKHRITLNRIRDTGDLPASLKSDPKITSGGALPRNKKNYRKVNKDASSAEDRAGCPAHSADHDKAGHSANIRSSKGSKIGRRRATKDAQKAERNNNLSERHVTFHQPTTPDVLSRRALGNTPQDVSAKNAAGVQRQALQSNNASKTVKSEVCKASDAASTTPFRVKRVKFNFRLGLPRLG